MSYGTDGKCHNAEPDTDGHECGKLAQWVGTDSHGFACCYCSDCKANGSEARFCVSWQPFEQAPHVVTIDGRLYRYGPTRATAVEAFRSQISGADPRHASSMRARCSVVRISDDEASQVAEMLAADAISWS